MSGRSLPPQQVLTEVEVSRVRLLDLRTWLDRSRPVVTVCRSGGRATQAAEALSAAGLRAAFMDGGVTR